MNPHRQQLIREAMLNRKSPHRLRMGSPQTAFDAAIAEATGAEKLSKTGRNALNQNSQKENDNA